MIAGVAPVPSHHFARPVVQHHGPINKLVAHADVADVGDPQLVRPCICRCLAQLEYTGRECPALGCHHKFALPQSERIIQLHQPQHALVIRREARVTQCCGHPPVAIAAVLGNTMKWGRRPRLRGTPLSRFSFPAFLVCVALTGAPVSGG